MTEKKHKVLVAVPSGDMIHARFVTSMMDLLFYTKTAEVSYFNQISSRITDNRNVLAAAAQKGNFTHILYIDSDMTFPSTGLDDLLAHDLQVVGATARKRLEGEPLLVGTVLDTQDMITQKHMVKMKVLGLPFMLVKIGVFDKLQKPYFAEPVDGENVTPEDVYFCQKLHEAGIDIWCDMHLTSCMGHLGIKEYKVEPVKMEEPAITLVEAA